MREEKGDGPTKPRCVFCPGYLVVFGVGHVLGLHGAVLGRFAGELDEEEQLLKDGGVHDLQVLRAHTDGLQQERQTDTHS